MEDLILAVLNGEASQREQRALFRWRNESHENERIYQEYVLTWQLLPLHTSQEPASAPPPLEQIVDTGNRRRMNTIPLKSLRKRHSQRWWWAMSAAAAAGVALLIGVPALRLGPPDLMFTTGVDESRTIQLDDGSVIRLGPLSRLGVWSERTRQATFSGLGFFAIASDSTSPFVVSTEAGFIKVLGTRFEARARADSLRLVVVEGRVALSASRHSVEVDGGELARIEAGGRPSTPQQVDVWSKLDWWEGLLIFRDTPLIDVVAELERVFGVPISINGLGLASRAVTAWFGNEPFEEVIEAVCHVVGASCVLGEGVEMRP